MPPASLVGETDEELDPLQPVVVEILRLDRVDVDRLVIDALLPLARKQHSYKPG